MKLPGFFGGKYELPMTKMEAKRDGWVSMDGGKCDGKASIIMPIEVIDYFQSLEGECGTKGYGRKWFA